MSAINSTIRVTDGMSKALRSMNKALNLVLNSFDDLQDLSSNAVDTSNIEEARAELTKAASAVNTLENNMDEAGKEIDEASQKAKGLESVISKVATAAGGLFVFSKIKNFIQGCTEAFDTQLNAENQLAAVLKNRVGKEYENVFNTIKTKASEIQKQGIYGDEAMLAGAGELATYFTDSSALEKMMDTLADYAMGMSGGGEVSSNQMVEYATGIGKIMTGSFEAMTKKGFEFTDVQKKIIKGTATEAEIVATLGKKYANMSNDMRSAAVITSVIDESWAGLYETMSDTPQGKIIQLKNTWGDIKEMIAEKLSPAFEKFTDYLSDNMPKIAELAGKVADGFAKILEFVAPLGGFIVNNFGTVVALIGAVTTATTLWKVAQLGLNSAMWSNPILMIIGLLGLLVYWILQAQDTGTEAAGVAMTALHYLATFFENVTVIILDCLQAIANILLDAIKLIYKFGTALGGVMSSIPDELLPEEYRALLKMDISSLNFADEYEAFVKNSQAIREDDIWNNALKQAENKKREEEAKALADKYANLDPTEYLPNDLGDDIGDIKDKTSGIAKTLEVSEEDLKFLRDIAEKEAINRFTTAEIKIDMQNNNSISSEMDIDGIVSSLEDRLYESMAIAAEGAF